jgi:hypothetical protein
LVAVIWWQPWPRCWNSFLVGHLCCWWFKGK